MKMTIEIDDERLSRVMKLIGINTKKAAIDYALRSAERFALRKKLLTTTLTDRDLNNSVDPAYDIESLRKKEIFR